MAVSLKRLATFSAVSFLLVGAFAIGRISHEEPNTPPPASEHLESEANAKLRAEALVREREILRLKTGMAELEKTHNASEAAKLKTGELQAKRDKETKEDLEILTLKVQNMTEVIKEFEKQEVLRDREARYYDEFIPDGPEKAIKIREKVDEVIQKSAKLLPPSLVEAGKTLMAAGNCKFTEQQIQAYLKAIGYCDPNPDLKRILPVADAVTEYSRFNQNHNPYFEGVLDARVKLYESYRCAEFVLVWRQFDPTLKYFLQYRHKRFPNVAGLALDDAKRQIESAIEIFEMADDRPLFVKTPYETDSRKELRELKELHAGFKKRPGR